MSLTNASHKLQLREAGWHSRGYLPHFDGRAIPQFITLHLGDAVPKKVIAGWQTELSSLKEQQKQIVLLRRIEKYLDQGHGRCLLKDQRIAGPGLAAEVRWYSLHFVCLDSDAKPFTFSAQAI